MGSLPMIRIKAIFISRQRAPHPCCRAEQSSPSIFNPPSSSLFPVPTLQNLTKSHTDSPFRFPIFSPNAPAQNDLQAGQHSPPRAQHSPLPPIHQCQIVPKRATFRAGAKQSQVKPSATIPHALHFAATGFNRMIVGSSEFTFTPLIIIHGLRHW